MEADNLTESYVIVRLSRNDGWRLFRDGDGKIREYKTEASAEKWAAAHGITEYRVIPLSFKLDAEVK